MRIKKVRIRNFRSIIDSSEISLDDKITILLGKNEQGKTNFLKAIESFDKDYEYQEDDLSYLLSHGEISKIPIITIWFILDNAEKKDLISINESFEISNELVITKYFDGHYEIEKPDMSKKLQLKIENIKHDILNLFKKNENNLKQSVNCIDKIDKTKHINWLKSLQKSDGGFSHVPGQASHITYTYFAVRALIELGGLEQIDKNKLIQFVVSCQNQNGGFGHLPNQQPQVQFVYNAILLLKELGALDKIDKTKHINWLKSLQKSDGGFSHVPGQASHITYTYFAVRALIELGGLEQIDKNKLIQFVVSCQNQNGGFGHLPNQQPQVQFVYNAILLLKELGALDKIDKTKHINWLKSLQKSDGGFSHVPGQASHITYTYFAVRALIELGGLEQIDKNKLIQFVVSCQNQNGGFGHLPNQQPQVQFVYNAILLLKELDAYLMVLYNEYIEKLKKATDATKIDKILTNIINFPLINVELVDVIKKDLENLRKIINNNLQNKILNLIHNFVYFDSIDFVGDSISLDQYLNNKDKYRTFSNLFQLANLDIEKIKNTKNPHTISRFFKKATTNITGMINEFWEQEEVTVNLEMIGDEILVSIDDKLGAKADPPSRRSDGFRWFLSFYINFIAGTNGELSNAVILLDNIGWLLHPSGQKDFLRALEKISKTNQIIFSTHSPFLIDKNKLERIRIVERKESKGTKIYEKFWDTLYDSLYVIRASIGADISDSLFGHKNNIIVEGISDKVYLETINNYLKKKNKKTIKMNKVMINGAGGADKILYLWAWQKAEKYNVLALVDADNEGRKVVQEIKSKYMYEDSEILKLDEISNDFKGKDIEIEDLFNEEFYHMAVNRAYKDIFESKLKKSEIKLEEVSTNGLRTKRYSKFFKDNGLGSFDKIKVALEIKKILSKKISKDTENTLKETIDNFEKLFEKIKEKFKNKEIEL